MSELSEYPPDEGRLYGPPLSEYLHSTLAEAWEAHLDDLYEPPVPGEIYPFIEWDVHDPREHLPSIERIMDDIYEWVGDTGMVDEVADEKFHAAIHNPATRQAIDDLLADIASRVPYRMARNEIARWQIRVDLGDGHPWFRRHGHPPTAFRRLYHPAKETTT